MKTPSTSKILQLAGKMKRPTVPIPRAAKRKIRSLTSFTGFGVLFLILVATAFYTASSASSVSRLFASGALPSEAAAKLNNKQSSSSSVLVHGRFLPSGMFSALLPQGPGDEMVETFAADCTTPQAIFNLGDIVCAKATNAPLRNPYPLRSFNWSGTRGFIRQSEDVDTDPDTNLFTIPSSNTSIIEGEIVDNRGTWAVSINSTGDNTTRAIAYFTVSDPANAAADLQVSNISTDTGAPIEPGDSTGFYIAIANTGPNTATNVHVTQATPPNMGFVSAIQSGGPTLTCANAAGITDCTISSLAPGVNASYTINYLVSGGAPNGVISSVADISSDISDPRPGNNSAEGQVEIRTAGAPPATCSLSCPPDVIATANTTNGNNESGAYVTYAGEVEVSGDCGAVSFTPASGTFFTVGSHAVSVLSATGGGSCSFTVSVLASAAPTISCPADKTEQAAAGQTEASVDPGTPTTTPTPGPGITVSGIRNDNRDVTDPYPVGVTTITWRVTDADNRTASCQQVITVTSADAFSISCPPNRTFTSTGCNGFTATSNDIGSPTTAGGVAPVVITGERSDHLHLYNDPYPGGQTVITWTATDDAGRVVSCNQIITVNNSGTDTTPPTLNVPPDVSATTSSCSATLDDELGVATAEDDCSSTTISRSGVPTFACPTPSDPNRRCESFVFPTGTTVITYTARDASGNTTTGTQNVTVTESPAVPPTVTAPADSSAFADASCQAAVPDYVAGSTASDNCGSVTVSQNPTAGTLVGYGPHTVIVTATDKSGNTTTDNVVFTVNDNTPPSVTAPADSSANADASCQAAVPNYAAASTGSDNCGTVTFSQTPAAGTLVGYGPHTVTVTANDGHGNTATDDVVFTVNDNTPPTITAPADSAAFADGSCLAPVPDYRPGTTAADNCGSVTLSQSPAPGTLVGYGPHTVTVTANDGHGNTASDNVVFTVNDNTPPVFTSCPTSQTIEPTCPTGGKAFYATPTATDNCGVTVTRTAGPASGSVFPIGTTTVTHVANDGHGNTATCTFTVTVLTPQAVVQNLINSVSASSLTGTQKNGLLAKLNAALDGINQGKINVACNKLSDFVNNVATLISHGDITAAQGNAWISSANHVRNNIGCTNLPCS